MARQPSRIGYKFLGSSKNFLYDARETGKTHTTFAYELLLYRAIQNGDITGVDNAITLYRNSGLVIGHMSDNPLREIHYWQFLPLQLRYIMRFSAVWMKVKRIS